MIALVFAILGLCLGSFVNALVWRLHKNKVSTMLRGRSQCTHCKKTLQAKDLIPVVSWLMLRGRCRYCKKPIDDSPLVEIGLALAFALSFIFWPQPLDDWYNWVNFAVWLAGLVGLAALFVYDLRWFLLPDKIVWPLIILASANIAIQFFAWQPYGDALATLQYYAYGLLPIAGLYWFIHTFSKGKMVGLGDVKLGIFIGLSLGWPGALLTLFLANVLGALFVLPLMFTGKLKRDSRVPFGPFLIVSYFFAGLWGEYVLHWYLAGLL